MIPFAAILLNNDAFHTRTAQYRTVYKRQKNGRDQRVNLPVLKEGLALATYIFSSLP
jgi:hypothetical protein